MSSQNSVAASKTVSLQSTEICQPNNRFATASEIDSIDDCPDASPQQSNFAETEIF